MTNQPPAKLLFFSLALFFSFLLIPPLATAADFPGGFLEQPSTATARALLTRSQLLNLLPARGKFTFPAPYNTTAIRLTTDADCNNTDCVKPVGYSYWNNINNHVGKDTMLIYVVFDKNKGGAGPTLLQYNKVTDAVQNIGPVFDSSNALSWGSGEGWYFSATMPTALYVNSGPSMLRYDVMSKTSTTVYDIRTLLGSGHYIWQMHSSANDQVHSATVRKDGTSEMLGCVTYNEASKLFLYFARKGAYDECQIDKSGKWLVIKENLDGKDGEDNRIINLDTMQERVLLDAAGAGGHSDMGHGYMIAQDNFANAANTQKLWNFNASTLSGVSVYHNADWNVGAPAHVSHSNALPGVATDNQYACGSSLNSRNSAEANEVICFGLGTADRALVVAPVMTDLNASGGGDAYYKSPKGNLDVTGKYFIWTSNAGGPRLDFFLVKVPNQLLPGTVNKADTVSGTSTGGTTSSTGSTSTSTTPSTSTGSTTTTTADVTAPVQSNFTVDSITSTGARINWNTNEAAEDMVQYGLTTSYGSQTTISTTLVTAHSRSLANLQAGKLYHYRVFTRDAAGNIATSGDMTFSTTSTTAATSSTQVTNLGWTNLVNATASGNTVTKTSGCDGCADAGAVSSQGIRSGNGYLEFTVTDPRKMLYTGLSMALTGTTANQIDFGMRIQSGYVEIRENGIYRKDSTIALGDVLRIAVTNGKVSYARNGNVFYTSTTAPAWPLRSYATLYSTGSSVGNAKLMGSLQSF